MNLCEVAFSVLLTLAVYHILFLYLHTHIQNTQHILCQTSSAFSKDNQDVRIFLFCFCFLLLKCWKTIEIRSTEGVLKTEYGIMCFRNIYMFENWSKNYISNIFALGRKPNHLMIICSVPRFKYRWFLNKVSTANSTKSCLWGNSFPASFYSVPETIKHTALL